MKIAVYAIAKNEEIHAARFIESCAGADSVTVLDTGSTDNTAGILTAGGARVVRGLVAPWRFDTARNAALAIVPADADVCISLDLDEVLLPGWRAAIEAAWEPGRTSHLFYGFEWSGGVTFPKSNVHSRTGWRWQYPCHEALMRDPSAPSAPARTDAAIIRDAPLGAKPGHAGYLALLTVGATESPHDPRALYYLGRELYHARQLPEAVGVLKRALQVATWDLERAHACRMIGRALLDAGEGRRALPWFRLACGEAPASRDAWTWYAEAAYRLADWPECHFAAVRATECPPSADHCTDPASNGPAPWDLAALACYHLGMVSRAREYGRRALALAPDDERLRANLGWYDGRPI